MFFKNKLLIFFSFLLLIIPTSVLAYSDHIILGGQNIGIQINTKGIMIVGFYDVDGKSIGKDAGLLIGDTITKINNIPVSSISDMKKIIDASPNTDIDLTIERGKESLHKTLKLVKENDVYKTGIYAKDCITGIGTLTYIDPETRIFGSLGHEVIESNSNKQIVVEKGSIFKSNVTGITKSTETTTGEKNANFYRNVVYGTINKNTISGIYGNYNSTISNDNLIEVGEVDDIKLGKAFIVTTLTNNELEEYEIEIIKINKNTKTKNILFEIKDSNLINETNGIIKGMSGSPIIQDNKIIGAVTHAIVNDNRKGYGIFITTMLKEGDK